tara:strand:- start:129 stop:836 length:708 start_codon:yes stop_codon:yes gene_type:complete
MVSVQSVYETVKNLANKDQKGFVSPSVFNSFAKIAQLNIINEIFEDLYNGKKLRRMNADGAGHLSTVVRSKSDLSALRTKKLITKNTTTSVFDKPLDFSTAVSCSLSGSKGNAKKIVHLLYEEEKINQLLSSTLSAPTADYPVALVSESLEVFPTSISRVVLTYLRTPQNPSYQIQTVTDENGASIQVFSSSSSLDFELPPHYESEVVAEIAKMIGIRIRDKDVYKHGTTEETQA